MGKKKEESIRLSKKHGLNPSILKCFWCGEESNGIALFGRVDSDDKKDMQAPPSVIDWSYTPCDKCKAQIEQGVHFVAVSDKPLFAKQPPLSGLYPQGPWMVMKREALPHIIADPNIVDKALECGILLMSTETLQQIQELVQDDKE